MFKQALTLVAFAAFVVSCSSPSDSSSGLRSTSDADKITQIGKGDKLFLTADLNVPANTNSMYSGSGYECGMKVDGCSLILNSSDSNRVLKAGTELVFSGITQAEPTKVHCYGTSSYVTYTAEVEGSQTVKAVQCYWLSGYEANDLYITGMKKRFAFAQFVPASPIPSN